MRSALSKRMVAFAVSSILVACGGGGGGGTPPPTVASVVITTPAGSPTFGALGRTVQFAAQARDAANAVVSGVTFTWVSSNTAVATVDGTGLVTSAGNGTTNIVATGSGIPSTARVVTVAQVVASVAVTSTSSVPDTLFVTGRTRQYSAAPKDSTGNAVAAAPAVTWASSVTGVATVGASTGLAMAVDDGSANIQATSGVITGSRTLIVRRLAQSHSITPSGGTITTAGGTAGPFTGAALDSNGMALNLSWLSRSTGTVTVFPATGGTTTATATGNGSTRVVLSVPSGPVDSVTVAVSGQPGPPATIAVTVGDDFFKSARNLTTQPAVDTVAVNGTVTWTWVATSNPHFVLSTGSPSFTGQTTSQTSGSFQHVFTTAGTFTYQCGVHFAAMTGIIVVR